MHTGACLALQCTHCTLMLLPLHLPSVAGCWGGWQKPHLHSRLGQLLEAGLGEGDVRQQHERRAGVLRGSTSTYLAHQHCTEGAGAEAEGKTPVRRTHDECGMRRVQTARQGWGWPEQQLRVAPQGIQTDCSCPLSQGPVRK